MSLVLLRWLCTIVTGEMLGFQITSVFVDMYCFDYIYISVSYNGKGDYNVLSVFKHVK
jgi:hypothetical protein